MLEVMTIRNVPSSNLNRDDMGMPKECNVGGSLRGRISSQCKKFNMRESEYFKELCEGVGKSIRTKKVDFYVIQEMKTQNLSDDFKLVISALCKTLGHKEKTGVYIDKTTNCFNFDTDSKGKKIKANIDFKKLNKQINSDTEVSAMPEEKEDKKTQIQVLSLDEIKNIASIMDLFVEKSEGNIENFCKFTNKNVIEQLKGNKIQKVTLDKALFGSMSATELSDAFPSSMKIAHSFSTNKLIRETDFFTATDTFMLDNPTETSGSAHLGELYFNSNCFFEYMCLDENLLLKNLGEIENAQEIAQKLIPELIRLFVTTLPSGKQASFAAYTPVDAVCVNIKNSNVAYSGANAFETPAKCNEFESLSQNSISKLVDEIDIMDKAFEYDCKARYWLNIRSDKAPKNGVVVESLNELIECVCSSLELKV